MQLTGMVVSIEGDPEARIQHTVFVEPSQPLLFIKRIEPFNWRAMSKDERKFHEKEAKKTSLVFGDWIKFDSSDVENRVIKKYEKEYAVMEVRYSDGCDQVEAVCVFKPPVGGEEPVCQSQFLGTVRATPEIARCYLADVAYRLWVEVKVSRIMTAEFHVRNYVSISEDQDCVANMPWNLHEKRFIPKVREVVDDAGESDDGVYQLQTQHRSLFDGKGIVIGRRSIYSYEFADAAVLIGYVPLRTKFEVGRAVTFDVEYSAPLNAYITTSCRPVGKGTDKVAVPFKAFEFGSEYMFQVSVKWTPELPFGYLWAGEPMLGVVHDPRGLLTSVLLAGARIPLQVYVHDKGPSTFSRFAVMNIEAGDTPSIVADTMKRYEPLASEGIVLDGGNVLCPTFSTLQIRLTDESSPSKWPQLRVGSWIRFLAKSRPGNPVFIVVEWVPSFDGIRQPIANAMVDSTVGRAYATMCHWEARLGVLRSEVFACVDDPDGVVKSRLKVEGTPIKVWVVAGRSLSRTPFVAYSMDDEMLKNRQLEAENTLEEAPFVLANEEPVVKPSETMIRGGPRTPPPEEEEEEHEEEHEEEAGSGEERFESGEDVASEGEHFEKDDRESVRRFGQAAAMPAAEAVEEVIEDIGRMTVAPKRQMQKTRAEGQMQKAKAEGRNGSEAKAKPKISKCGKNCEGSKLLRELLATKGVMYELSVKDVQLLQRCLAWDIGEEEDEEEEDD